MLVDVPKAMDILLYEIKEEKLRDIPFSDKVDAAVKFSSVEHCSIDTVRRINTNFKAYISVLQYVCLQKNKRHGR